MRALSRQIDHNHAALGQMAGSLMGLGDETATRLAAVTRRPRQALDRAGRAWRRARPRRRECAHRHWRDADRPAAAPSSRRCAWPRRCARAGQHSIEQAAAFQASVEALSAADARTPTRRSTTPPQRLVQHLTQVESAGAAAALRVQEAGDVTNAGIDALLVRAADSLIEIRSGIDAQAATRRGAARPGAGRARPRRDRGQPGACRSGSTAPASSLDALTARIAEQERASQRLVADLDNGLVALDDRFARLAEQGDERAARLSGHVGRLRAELDSLGGDTGAQDQALARARRPHRGAARRRRRRLSLAVAQELGGAFGEAEAGASRLLAATDQARPSIEWMQGAANDTAERLIAGQQAVEAQRADG